MTQKTYTNLKFLATVGSVLNFTAPLLVLLDITKDLFSNNQQAMLGTTLAILFLGLAFTATYIYLRLRFKTKSEYEYKKKETRKLFLSFAFYILAFIFGLIIILVLKDDLLVFYIMYPILFVLTIIGSVFETLSRIGEQIFLTQQEELKEKEVKEKKITKIVQEKDLTDSEKLLNKSVGKTNKDNPFMNEKLNKELEEESK